MYCAAIYIRLFHLHYMFRFLRSWLSLLIPPVCGGVVFGIFWKMQFKNIPPLATSFFELAHQWEVLFRSIDVLFDDFVLLRKMDLCCTQIVCGALLCQFDFFGCSSVYLIQTDSGFLWELFITDARAFQTAKHPHCFVLYGHFVYLRFCCSRCIFFLDIHLPEERKKNKNSFWEFPRLLPSENTSLRSGRFWFLLPSMTI